MKQVEIDKRGYIHEDLIESFKLISEKLNQAEIPMENRMGRLGKFEFNTDSNGNISSKNNTLWHRISEISDEGIWFTISNGKRKLFKFT